MQIMKYLLNQPDIDLIQDPQVIDEKYRYWRIRTMYTVFIGYAIFYFCRKNLSAVMVPLSQDLGYSKTQLGILWSSLYLSYAVSKFANGVIGDRANPRYFMAIGLILTAICNFFFGLSSSLYLLALWWALNGWFQGMGWPPCARSLSQWYSPKERGLSWGIWNASHQIGGAGILFFAAWLAEHYGWRSAFFVPGVIALLTAAFIINRLRDHPGSLGLPAIEVYKGEAEVADSHKPPLKEVLFKHVLNNKFIWLIAFGNFFVYIVRYGTIDWMPMYLVEMKGSSLTKAGAVVATFEIMGILGAIAAGIFSDRIFKAQRGPVNFIFMTFVLASLFIFKIIPAGNLLLDIMAMGFAGFFIYGPQLMTSIHAADISSKEAAGAATGLVGFMGYLGSLTSGIGTGWVVDHFGWEGGFMFFILCAALGICCFALTWKTKNEKL
jgi:OPA family sugar phosphate sensor protein UhpC-like MFS transporter